MKIAIISYSFTGNNHALAASMAHTLTAEHTSITETRRRTMFSIFLDVLFNRTPKVHPPPAGIPAADLVIFIAPVWMGQVATPLRDYFRQFKNRIGRYAFVTISGGADGANPKLAGDLTKRLGKEPATLIDMAISDLLPPAAKMDRNATMAYRLNETDVQQLTKKILAKLKETLNVEADEWQDSSPGWAVNP